VCGHHLVREAFSREFTERGGGPCGLRLDVDLLQGALPFHERAKRKATFCLMSEVRERLGRESSKVDHADRFAEATDLAVLVAHKRGAVVLHCLYLVVAFEQLCALVYVGLGIVQWREHAARDPGPFESV